MAAPNLILFDGDLAHWEAYCESLYAIYIGELVRSGLTFRGMRVGCRRHPETRGKAAGFWHLIQEGRIEEDRTPDLRRCERLPLVSYIIIKVDSDPNISCWETDQDGGSINLFYHPHKYLVVLGKRNGYVLLKTAFHVEYSHREEKLMRQRDEWLKKMGRKS